jgi:CHASE2 domain-containing sensor protein
MKRRLAAIDRELDSLFAAFPKRAPNTDLALRLNQASRWYPRLILWIGLGLIALLFRRPRETRTLLAIALAALAVIALNALGLFADPHFALPVAPAFVFFGSCALLGRR